MEENRYCRRLIETDLPIKTIGKWARDEKQFPIPRGHISTFHIWWARRPLAACRAVILAMSLLDPGDPLCEKRIKDLYRKELRKLSGKDMEDDISLRKELLNFIGNFSAWNLATDQTYLEIGRNLIKAVDQKDELYLFDPFAGGGAIPFEGIRLGINVFASDLNPIPVLLNKVLLEELPNLNDEVISLVQKYGEEVLLRTRKELSEYYHSSSGETTLAYIWARTAKCEGPKCGKDIPLMRSFYLSNKGERRIHLRIRSKDPLIDFDIQEGKIPDGHLAGTIMRGSVICPACSFVTKVDSIRKQMSEKHGGTNSSRLMAIVYSKDNVTGKHFRLPTDVDIKLSMKARKALQNFLNENPSFSLPNEDLPPKGTLGFRVQRYGMTKWKDLFLDRQSLGILTFIKNIKELKIHEKDKERFIKSVLAIALNKIPDFNCGLSGWRPTNEDVGHVFGRQILPMVWDFVETNLCEKSFVDWERALKHVIAVLVNVKRSASKSAVVAQSPAGKVPLPDDSATLLFTDPPYYDSVPYSCLSDFFYVWLKRSLGEYHKDIFSGEIAPKAEEAIVDVSAKDEYGKIKDTDFYEKKMQEAFADARRVLRPDGIAVVVFAHKTTAGWESILSALINAGWIVTASWPIDTESGTRLRAMNSAALTSSIHLVCRPRETADGKLLNSDIGDWRQILQDLPKKIHEWMPRLSEEGVVGADAIFSCLGPALEIFSKHSQVEKANGEKVELKEYLEQVWAAVAKEALNMIFEGARTEGFEEDARLTAMWLWTLSTSGDSYTRPDKVKDDSEDSEEDSKSVKISGFTLEYDAARKIAQGLGAHLEDLNSVISVDGETATLLPVGGRIQYLFGKGSMAATPAKKKKKENQMTLFEEFNKVEEQGWSLGDEKSAVGKTVLDRVHQAMILFGAGRGDAMRRFLVEEGIGKDERFWRLAQALSALYPSNTDEKRWVDGVLARKKSLGF